MLPSAVSAVGSAAAVMILLVAGDRLPGGRWRAAHLFTLGVLTTAHGTVTRTAVYSLGTVAVVTATVGGANFAVAGAALAAAGWTAVVAVLLAQIATAQWSLHQRGRPW